MADVSSNMSEKLKALEAARVQIESSLVRIPLCDLEIRIMGKALM